MSLEFRGVHAEVLADETPELDLEGGRNSGKTWVIAAKVVYSCLRHPGIEWLICRYSGTETKNKLKPEFQRICRLLGVAPEWNNDEECYEFPEQGGLVSKVFAYGLKTQDALARYAKIRGLGIACVWNDQTEELPADIAKELRAVMRQPGYPHQLIFSPNPPNEDHYLADEFPEDNSIPNRKYYRVSLYDNRHNLPDETIDRLEQAYPPTHAKYKSLILGQRGVNVIGKPIYGASDADTGVFDRALHLGPVTFDVESPLLEAIDCGKHHPVWLAAQRSPFGGLIMLGGIMGKRLLLHDFLPLVKHYRAEWFPTVKSIRTAIDPPPPGAAGSLRYSNLAQIKAAGFAPKWRDNANAADVREAVIQSISGHMERRLAGFRVNSDPSRWLMASSVVVKQSRFFLDGLEGAYVWDEHWVSVGHKKYRQPKVDEWVDGAQRCLENIALNFCADRPTQAEEDRLALEAKRKSGPLPQHGPNAWMM